MKAIQNTITITAILMMVLWGHAAVVKLYDYDTFYLQLDDSPLTKLAPRLVSILLPVAEIMLFFMIPIQKTRKLGMFLSLLLMVMFTAYIIYLMEFASNVPCPCGGIISGFYWKEHLMFNCVFLAINLIGCLMIYKQGKIQKTKENKKAIPDQIKEETHFI